jgi:nucleoside-diphosphate-sugar epimerase
LSLSNNILITGITGFIGQALQQHLLAKNKNITALLRRKNLNLPIKVNQLVATDNNSWAKTPLPKNITTLIHLAGRAHILKETSDTPLELFRKDNVESTLQLAQQALIAGVKRFIFISSIGVNGQRTTTTPFNELSTPSPKADYAISKWEAEQGLHNLVNGSGMELVIIRPPLVYAGHAPGNFQRLLKLVSTGLPLPFSSIRNARSMISLDNLVDFIALCIEHPAAANETFLVSDGMDFSTAQIILHLADGQGKKVTLLPIPAGLMHWGAKLIGRENTFEQLCHSLVVDSSKARNLLQWMPKQRADEALIQAGRDFKVISSKS